jgi:hypothetical protein
MISSGKHMCAKIEEIIGNRWSYAKPAGRILGIDDNQVHTSLGNHMSQVLAHNAPPGAAKNVAYEKNPQNPFVS